MYEYIVGQYINKKNKQFSCFLETYGLFMYKNEAQWDHVKNTKSNISNVFTNSLTQIITNPMDTLSIGCDKSKYMCILIQHISKTQTLSEKLDTNYKLRPFLQTQLLYILYQIYLPLSLLVDEFTHYDLHMSNVLLYQIQSNKYIEYHYHLPKKIIKFKSLYIVKIIDYGRSYFNDKVSNIKSKDVYNKLCKQYLCKPNCGENVGFSWLAKEDFEGDNYFIISQVVNHSHDLRLFSDMYMIQGDRIKWGNSEIYKLIKNTVYDTDYGTKNIKHTGLSKGKIFNVSDAVIELQKMIEDPKNIELCDILYANPLYSKYGDIHIYSDGKPMIYKPVNK